MVRAENTAMSAEQRWGVNKMRKNIVPVIVGKPYPTAMGNGCRCFDGKKWYDCDKNGKLIKRARMDGE